MRKTNSFKVSSAKFRARTRRRRDAIERAEEREWASKSGPVAIYHVPPQSLRDRQTGYDVDGAAGHLSGGQPAA